MALLEAVLITIIEGRNEKWLCPLALLWLCGCQVTSREWGLCLYNNSSCLSYVQIAGG